MKSENAFKVMESLPEGTMEVVFLLLQLEDLVSARNLSINDLIQGLRLEIKDRHDGMSICLAMATIAVQKAKERGVIE